MGGLSGKAFIQLFDQGQKAIVLNKWKNTIASALLRAQHTLLFGKPLRAFRTNIDDENRNGPRVKNSGIVIFERIGQSACLLPNSISTHGRATETERVWVVASSEQLLKIQSTPLGKLRGRKVPTPTRCSINLCSGSCLRYWNYTDLFCIILFE